MGEDVFPRLLYLGLLLLAVGGYFLAEGRRRLGRTAQQAAIWALIFVGVIAGYGLWSDIRSTLSPRQMIHEDEGRIEVGRGNDGHFHLTLEVEGTPVEFVVDTGASGIVLTLEDARRVGIDTDALDFKLRALTANGEVAIAPVRLAEVRLGPITDRNLRASVNGGELFKSLLGMDYLGRFARIEIAGDRLILTR
ncbi:MAG: TIGR02281 family clan AA aspartic protease [Rhodobacteraceae bacterium]|nr:TIGR02281 family clan AA aspartic protease [Paracoccaceae bacterium]